MIQFINIFHTSLNYFSTIYGLFYAVIAILFARYVYYGNVYCSFQSHDLQNIIAYFGIIASKQIITSVAKIITIKI